MRQANDSPRIPEYDERLTRTERRRIRSAVRKIQGINHTVLSMKLKSDGIAEVHCGGGSFLSVLVVKFDGTKWIVDSCENSTFQ